MSTPQVIIVVKDSMSERLIDKLKENAVIAATSKNSLLFVPIRTFSQKKLNDAASVCVWRQTVILRCTEHEESMQHTSRLDYV